MPKYRVSLPPAMWPEDIRSRFDKCFETAPGAHKRRLAQALGRWLKDAEQDNLPPDLITKAVRDRRLNHLRPEMAAAARQALQAVFPDVNIFAREARAEVESKRDALQREIGRNWHRLPAAWQEAAAPKLRFCPHELNDGLLVQAWSVETLRSCLQSAWSFFDFCRSRDLPAEITAKTVGARLHSRQEEFRAGLVAIATVHGEMQRLKSLGNAVFPDRSWRWIDPALKRLKKEAGLQPSRNDGRLVDLAELKAAAGTCAKLALKQHLAAVNFKKKTSANKLARSSLALSLLINSPIRLESLANLDLIENFDAEFTTLYLSAQETKDKKRDERLVSPELRTQLLDYIKYHRVVVAPSRETKLFVGSRHKPIGADYLSQSIGDLCEKLFDRRVTPHVVRNIIAGFVISEAPEQVGLASEILHHSSAATTEAYRAEAKQVKAGNKLREANDQGRAQLEPEKPFDAGRRRTLQRDLRVRRKRRTEKAAASASRGSPP